MDLTALFAKEATIELVTEGCFGDDSECITYPTKDPALNETLKSLVTAFAEGKLTNSGGATSNGYAVLLNDQEVYSILPFYPLPNEIDQLESAMMRAKDLSLR